MVKAAAVLAVYAVVVLALGVLAYAIAPPDANALTALIVPGVIALVAIACAAMAALINTSRAVGMVGIHLGLVVLLLVTLGVGHRAWATHQAVRAYEQALPEWRQALDAGEQDDTDQARAAFFEARDAPDHDKAYLRTTLLAVAGTSLAAFVLLLAMRPKPADRTPTTDDAHAQ